MKKVFFTLAIAALAFSANAQSKEAAKSLKFSVGVNAGLPIGDLKNVSSFVIGGDVQGEYAAAETASLTLSAGYHNWSGKNGWGSSSTIPVLLGGKFAFGEQFYGHAQLGVSFLSDGGGTAFTYAPSIGYQASENFDVSVKYQAFTKNSSTGAFIGVRAAYSF